MLGTTTHATLSSITKTAMIKSDITLYLKVIKAANIRID
jgi:hypothetical protein